MSHADKDKTRQRYYRMVDKLERRKENEARKGGRDGGRPADDDWDDWDSEAATSARASRKRPRRARAGGRSKSAPVGAVGLVTSIARDRVHLRVGDEELDLPLAHAVRSTPLAVGDELDLSIRGSGAYRIEGLRERRSELSRPDPGNRHRRLLVAANVDVGVVVAAATDPPLRPALIDRYAIALERGGVEPLVFVNKIDLCDRGERERIDELLVPYRELGFSIVTGSARSGDGIDALRERLASRVSVLVGHSGVGKSSTLNALAGVELADEGDVRAFDGRGRHTTTSSALHELPGDVRVIDTPGVRVFGLWDLRPEELRDAFPGFEPWSASCRFADCSHRGEPGCAVRAAAETGELSAARYATYLRILGDLEEA